MITPVQSSEMKDGCYTLCLRSEMEIGVSTADLCRENSTSGSEAWHETCGNMPVCRCQSVDFFLRVSLPSGILLSASLTTVPNSNACVCVTVN